MIESVLDTHYSAHFRQNAYIEKSVIILGAMEATLTPLMESIETAHPGVKVFSLPSVDHPQWGRHIELGVKGEPDAAHRAYLALRQGLSAFSLQYGPELVR
jgi:molybdopterin-biosynthesis enzyme MoeA-like protein